MIFAPASTFGLDGWTEKIALIGMTIAASALALLLIRLLTPRLVTQASRSSNPSRWQQQRTAVTLLATVLRYVVLVGAVTAIVLILVGAGGIGAIGGSAVIAVIIGFASQRLLADVIAGFFILFEGQFAVGDLVAFEPAKFLGIVEELGIRSTMLRGPDGSRYVVPNSQILGVRRFAAGSTLLAVVLLTRNPDEVEAAVTELGGLTAATDGVVGRLERIERKDLGDGVTAVRATVAVSAALTPAAESLIAATLRARLGTVLLVDPLVLPVEDTDHTLTGPVAI